MSLAEARSVRWASTFLGGLTEHSLTEQATIIAFNVIHAKFPQALFLAAIGGTSPGAAQRLLDGAP